MRQVNHLVIKRIDDDNYVLHNAITNKYVRLGLRETNYLLELLGEELEEETEDVVPLSNRQMDELKKKFQEWGFFDRNMEYKKKKDFSNLALFSIKPEGFIYKVLDKTKKLISPFGFGLFMLSVLYSIYAYVFEGEAMIAGLSKLRIDISSIVSVFFISIVTSIIHEFSHVSACYKYSGKCGRMGVKLHYLIPAYFCDVSNIYMVSEKKKEFVVAASGILSNHILGVMVLFIYNSLYHVGICSNVCMYFYLYNLVLIFFNMIPFAKFDGYWMTKALVGVDNLYDKSILLFIQLLFDIKDYQAVTMKPVKKIVVTLYGMLVFLFHWGLWAYGIYGVYYSIREHIPELKIFSLLLLGVIGMTNCIKFTMRYISLHKKQKESVK